MAEYANIGSKVVLGRGILSSAKAPAVAIASPAGTYVVPHPPGVKKATPHHFSFSFSEVAPHCMGGFALLSVSVELTEPDGCLTLCTWMT
jgi:hypothetical protein